MVLIMLENNAWFYEDDLDLNIMLYIQTKPSLHPMQDPRTECKSFLQWMR